MSNIQCLPLLLGAKFIIIDEGVEATLAETLIKGWLKMWEIKMPEITIEMLLFSSPKHVHLHQFESLKLNNINLIDFYSIEDIETVSIEEKLDNYLKTLPQNSIVIINCLSTLSLSVGLQQTVKFVEKLKKKVGQLISIYRRDFGKLNVPRIETFGTTYLRLEQHFKISQSTNFVYEGIYTHRKPGGSILRQSELVKQDFETYEISSVKILTDQNRKISRVTQEPIKEVKASFRIEMNDQEMEQRKNTPLPYTAAKNSQQTTIYYVPDDFDDDEEDPDDDLGI